jgi:hypothetical protein
MKFPQMPQPPGVMGGQAPGLSLSEQNRAAFRF